jgi:hypothetical protein
MCSVYDDVELLDWFRWAEGDGPSFSSDDSGSGVHGRPE